MPPTTDTDLFSVLMRHAASHSSSELRDRAKIPSEAPRIVEKILTKKGVGCSPDLLAIVEAFIEPELWPTYRDAGVVDLLLKLALERKFDPEEDYVDILPEEAAPWVIPMQGLLLIGSLMLRCQEQSSPLCEPESSPTYIKMHRAVPAILRRVLADTKAIRYAENRGYVAGYLQTFLIDCEMRWLQSIPEITSFAWTCWMASDLLGPDDEWDVFSKFLSELLVTVHLSNQATGTTITEPPPFPKDRVAQRALCLISKPHNEEEETALIVWISLTSIAMLHPEYGQAMLHAGVLEKCATLALSSESIRTQPTVVADLFVMMLDKDLGYDGESHKAFVRAVQSGFMSNVFELLMLITDDERMVERIEELAHRLHFFTAESPIGVRQVSSCLPPIQRRLSELTSNTSLPPQTKAVASHWSKYTTFVTLCAQHMKDNCAYVPCSEAKWNADVARYGEEVASKRVTPPKLRCSRCKCVGYCGAECQRKDWKKHKKYCMVIDPPIPGL